MTLSGIENLVRKVYLRSTQKTGGTAGYLIYFRVLGFTAAREQSLRMSL